MSNYELKSAACDGRTQLWSSNHGLSDRMKTLFNNRDTTFSSTATFDRIE